MNLSPSMKELANAEKKIVDFLKKYECGFVIGVSGGLDSALCILLARRASENVFALLLPDSNVSSSKDVRDAERFLQKIAVSYRVIDISPIVSCYKEKMEVSGEAGLNIAPRVRMTLLYMYANSQKVLVVGCSNRTELMLGYFTKYGDGGSDLCPIGGLFKTQVHALAKHLDVPQQILEKNPSAGLYAGQTDEGDLGASYDEMDAILHSLYEEKRSVDETARRLGMERDKVEKFRRLVRENAHKSRTPPFPKF